MPGPAMCPSPRMTSIPDCSAQEAGPESSEPETMKSRQAKAAPGSTPRPFTASAAPGASRAAWSASPGRSSVFDGMQAQ
jgi:hypothetical protein